MLVRRFWLDATGRPHVEEATLQPRTGDGPGVDPTGPFETEGDPLTGPAAVVALADPAPGLDALVGNLDQLYTVDLPEGVQVVDRATWEQTTAAAAAVRAAALADLHAERAAVEDQRQSALAKLATLAGLTDDERAALLGG